MAAHADVDRSLGYIRRLSERLGRELERLPAEAWDAPTNCPPWPLRRLVAHFVENAENIGLCVQRALTGQVDPPMTSEERERLVEGLAELSPKEMVSKLERNTTDLEALYEGLSAEELEAICYHRRGNRPARWYIQHRLVEVAFHLWDFERSLGRTARLDDEVAAFLLPTILESNLPRIYPIGPRGEGRFLLVAEGEPGASWLLAADPERLEVRRGGDGAEVTITAAPSVLALLAYGRANLAEEARRGGARVEGDQALVERFHRIFPGP